MTIQEQAQQLELLADQVPTGIALATKSDLEDLQAQVMGLLGETSTATAIQGSIQLASQQIDEVAAALENVRLQIRDAAQHHLQG
ncbi:hypothetical protein ACIA5G_48525 [Amycolatopsis sp. NPDC051758]|jgi:hypothetical protein|uniref:Uncharacterized protein n=2 Tax=Amycolatopsis TaxID=1813 RepID=A0A9Y2JR53_9PSEU|nr:MULTISPECIES: hypothetical protein [Amycolatopsis]MDT7800036.1 hypothetical protein [Actinomycetota bacterium]MEA5366372.1 hypothetical protein [Amycolatopsis sp., V23-08]UOZ11030.1 hypothetical protein MUY22_23270 [Amycolatopsis sp. WQ 127309]WIY02380.1 hypothetical protein QRX60_00455 [Amycolatopsis sp. 4-36]WSJ77320.1 hypothetical protein OG439_49565 [Amycolatopsis sp. NBC_01307]